MEQELQNQIGKLSDEIKSLTDKFSESESKSVDIKKKILDRYLDEDSKKIIEETIRRFYKKTSNTVGVGFTLEPATRFHQLTGTAARTSDTTTAIKDGTFIGEIMILEGTSNTNTITIVDNANTKLNGNVVLGLNETLTLMWNDTDWVEIGRGNIFDTVPVSLKITRDMTLASGAVTTAHGLDRLPVFVKGTAMLVSANGRGILNFATFDGTNTKNNYFYENATPLLVADTSTTNFFVLVHSSGNSQNATIAFDATNITLTWTKNGVPTDAAYILLEIS